VSHYISDTRATNELAVATKNNKVSITTAHIEGVGNTSRPIGRIVVEQAVVEPNVPQILRSVNLDKELSGRNRIRPKFATVEGVPLPANNQFRIGRRPNNRIYTNGRLHEAVLRPANRHGIRPSSSRRGRVTHANHKTVLEVVPVSRNHNSTRIHISVSTIEKLDILEHATGSDTTAFNPLEDAVLVLFKEVVPAQLDLGWGDVSASECDFSGYGRHVIEGWSGPYTGQGGYSLVRNGAATFELDAEDTINTVYGAGLLSDDSITLLAVELFNSPISLGEVGQGFSMLPIFGFGANAAGYGRSIVSN